MIKANFKIKSDETKQIPAESQSQPRRDLTKEEFEEYMVKAGAAGSFMVFRSSKKDEELGLEEI